MTAHTFLVVRFSFFFRQNPNMSGSGEFAVFAASLVSVDQKLS